MTSYQERSVLSSCQALASAKVWRLPPNMKDETPKPAATMRASMIIITIIAIFMVFLSAVRARFSGVVFLMRNQAQKYDYLREIIVFLEAFSSQKYEKPIFSSFYR